MTYQHSVSAIRAARERGREWRDVYALEREAQEWREAKQQQEDTMPKKSKTGIALQRLDYDALDDGIDEVQALCAKALDLLEEHDRREAQLKSAADESLASRFPSLER